MGQLKKYSKFNYCSSNNSSQVFIKTILLHLLMNVICLHDGNFYFSGYWTVIIILFVAIITVAVLWYDKYYIHSDILLYVNDNCYNQLHIVLPIFINCVLFLKIHSIVSVFLLLSSSVIYKDKKFQHIIVCCRFSFYI